CGLLAAQDVTFTTGTQLVVETVVVTDKNGKPVDGLTANDFRVTEDGVPQTIQFFDHQTLPGALAPLAPVTGSIAPYDRIPHNHISAERPGDSRYKDRRLLVLYFDMTAMPPSDQIRALEAAKKFIRTQMGPPDLMALMMYEGGAVRVIEDFTADRARLLSAVETLIVGEAQGFESTANDASAADTGAAFGQDDSEFNIFNTDRQLSALQTAANMLSQVAEKKSLIYFASGLRLNGLDNQAQLHATINAALRANLSFWPIDARGLVAESPLGDATQGSNGGLVMYTGGAAQAFNDNFQQSQDTLWALASDTHGQALLDYNDLASGIVHAQQAISSYYIIGYYTPNTALDGKFRRIKITLREGLSGNLDYRQGYYAGKKFSKFSAADKERQLEDALMLGDPITELTIAMEVNYFQLNSAEYFVPVTVKIPGRELALARRRGAEHTLIDFIGEIKDEYGSTITNVRDKVNIRLTDATAAELARRPIEYDTGFTVLPGKYMIKILARDAETGRIGTYQTTFVVPNLNKVEKRLRLSSVVLSGQRVELKDALYNAAKDKGRAESVDPLSSGGEKLIPSVTRVFSKSRDLYVYFQTYGAEPVLAFVTFYRDNSKSLETAPYSVTQTLPGKLKAAPVSLDISLAKLLPGKYNCQVTVLDPDSHKAAFWQAPVVLVP
ncbi:MAG TPA: VWA domain-containing protein, partial [Bryobacteraceae bacterium]|nr:VWA domain-containing protein [Bryobacteraceae bacterium]